MASGYQEYFSKLREGALECGINLGADGDTTLRMMIEYMDLALEENTRASLTSVVEPAAFIESHIIDSLAALALAGGNVSLIDVGTGAGLPGIILKIANPLIELTLLDATQKKLEAARRITEALGLEGVSFCGQRAEEASRPGNMREAYDIAIARAFGKLNALLEYLGGFAKVGGKVIAMKSSNIGQELEGSMKAAKKLGFGPPEVLELALPFSKAGRKLVVYTKLKPTHIRYPRPNAKIAKEPL
jgi:16S rRNA (guanine527-N7)-methyltransferase